jgi:hypothetical protein
MCCFARLRESIRTIATLQECVASRENQIPTSDSEPISVCEASYVTQSRQLSYMGRIATAITEDSIVIVYTEDSIVFAHTTSLL